VEAKAFASQVLYDAAVAAGYMKHYVPLPAEVATALGVVRVAGRIEGRPFRRSLQRRADGTWCLRFGASWLAEARLAVGEDVWVELEPDPDPDAVDLPDELAAALAADPDAAERWALLTTGRQRTLAAGVARGKAPATRTRKAAELVRELRAGDPLRRRRER
jgi:hypothetical protein